MHAVYTRKNNNWLYVVRLENMHACDPKKQKSILKHIKPCKNLDNLDQKIAYHACILERILGGIPHGKG